MTDERKRGRGVLTIVGTGFMVAGQVTPEARRALADADHIFYLVGDPVTRGWLAESFPRAESLYTSYKEGGRRDASYREMVERMLAPVRRGERVGVALYGHPGVFVNPSHAAILQAREEGHRAEMLPAISAEDCLFADLFLDPVRRGCQSFEATDFLSRARRFDPATPLILWQVGGIGIRTFSRDAVWDARPGLEALTRELLKSYPPDHEVVLYVAATLPVCDPSIRRVPLAELPEQEVSIVVTLLVPPHPAPPVDEMTVPAAPAGGQRRPGRLTVIGLGYGVAGQITPESLAAFRGAERAFFLAVDPATPHHLREVNPRAESLHDCYVEGEPGLGGSRRMVERIVAPLARGENVCAAFYGHPAMGMHTSHAALARARKAGHAAAMLPAVSIEDCLIADLGVDPAVHGRFLFDASELLSRPRTFDTRSALVLLQIGTIGLEAYRSGFAPHRPGLARLAKYLTEAYPPGHRAVLYQRSSLPLADPRVEEVSLEHLAAADVTVASTLYVPPVGPSPTPPDPEALERLSSSQG